MRRNHVFGLLLLITVLIGGCGRAGGSGGAAEEVALGWAAFGRGDFSRATDLFDGVARSTAPGDRLHDQAIYGLASTWAFRRPGENLTTAEGLFRQLIDTHAVGHLDAWSALAIARMWHVRPVGEDVDLGRVAALYQAVIDGFPGTLAADEAFVYQQTIVATTTDPALAARSLAELRAFVARRAGSPYVSPAYQLIAAACHTLRRPDEQLAAEIKALQTREEDAGNPTLDRAQAYWNIACVAEFDAGNLAVARQYYELFLKQAPNDQKAFPARQALERLQAIEANGAVAEPRS